MCLQPIVSSLTLSVAVVRNWEGNCPALVAALSPSASGWSSAVWMQNWRRNRWAQAPTGQLRLFQSVVLNTKDANYRGWTNYWARSTVLYSNNAFTQITGYTLEEVVGKTAQFARSKTDLNQIAKVRAALELGAGYGWSTTAKDGSEFWVEFSFAGGWKWSTHSLDLCSVTLLNAS